MSKPEKKSKKSIVKPFGVKAVETIAVAAPAVPVKAPAPKAEPVKSEPVKAMQPRPTGNKVSLEFLRPDAKHVFVAGSFNNWQPETTPLKPAGNGRWVGDLAVKPGRHEYLFVVDGQWLPDPNAREAVTNPFGGTNSVLIAAE